MWLLVPPWTSLPIPPTSSLFSFFTGSVTQPWNIHAGSEKWMHLPKGAEVEKREVSRFDTYSLMMKVTEGFESSLARGNVDDVTACRGRGVTLGVACVQQTYTWDAYTCHFFHHDVCHLSEAGSKNIKLDAVRQSLAEWMCKCIKTT